MAEYNLVFTKHSIKQLKKLDKHQAKLIRDWLYINIEGANNPRSKGKGLTANLSNLWRYRVGNYRIICEIEDNQLVVTAVNVGHRKEIYK